MRHRTYFLFYVFCVKMVLLTRTGSQSSMLHLLSDWSMLSVSIVKGHTLAAV